MLGDAPTIPDPEHAMSALRSRLTGLGFHVPPRTVTNHDLESLMDTSDAWIVERTGIRERHFVDPGTGSSDLGTEAARRALADAGRTAADVDFVIFATTTPDYMFPGNGVLVQQQLGLGTVGALDVRNACSGFLYGLSVADAFVRMGRYRCVLVIGAEVQSTGLDLSTRGRDMAVLFNLAVIQNGKMLANAIVGNKKMSEVARAALGNVASGLGDIAMVKSAEYAAEGLWPQATGMAVAGTLGYTIAAALGADKKANAGPPTERAQPVQNYAYNLRIDAAFADSESVSRRFAQMQEGARQRGLITAAA